MKVALAHAMLLAGTLVAGVVFAPPLEPVMSVGLLAPAIGIASGTALFLALSGHWISFRGLIGASKRRLLARSLVLSLKSAQEEALWRGVLLGLIVVSAGRATGLVLSTAAFAAAHLASQGRRAAVHLVTGSIFGAAYVLTGDLTAAISSHVTYNVLIGAGLLAQQNLSVSANSGGGSGALASRLLQNGEVPRANAKVGTSQDGPPVASLQAVRKSFGRVVALDTVDLELRPGEILALLGPNGAGKSTAVAIMLGLRRADAGRATLFGGDPRDAASRRHVGAVLQDVSYPSGLRVSAAVELIRAHFPEAGSTEEVLSRLDLASAARRDAGGLSGGQRRRLAVALALAGKPRALFLDEPTAGLDATARRGLLRDIVSFAAEGGAVLLTTQQLDEAEEIASRVVLIDRGRLMLDGTVAEIRARGGLTRVTFRASQLPELPGVISSESRGDRHVVYVDDADALVGELVRTGAAFSELEVARSSLEDAFVALTDEAVR